MSESLRVFLASSSSSLSESESEREKLTLVSTFLLGVLGSEVQNNLVLLKLVDSWEGYEEEEEESRGNVEILDKRCLQKEKEEDNGELVLLQLLLLTRIKARDMANTVILPAKAIVPSPSPCFYS